MKLVIDEEEADKVLLAWANSKFNCQFDTVRMDVSYSSFKGVEFTREKAPEKSEGLKEPTGG